MVIFLIAHFRADLFLRAKIFNFLFDFSDIWNLGDYCRQKQREYEEKGMHIRRNCVPDSELRIHYDSNGTDDGPAAKRIKPMDDPNIYTRNIAYYRAHYIEQCMPKVVLHAYATKNGLKLPTYSTIQEDRLFQTIITFQDQKYASSYWEKNKRFAEQGAALVCLLKLGLVNEEDLIKNGSLTK